MTAFADTSALYAFLDKANRSHELVTQIWDTVSAGGGLLVTTNYTVLETAALCQSRFGPPIARDLFDRVVPGLDVHWVDQEVHEAAVAALLVANRRDLSLVDCVSFEVMRRLDIRQAFTLDEHFREQGFEVVP